MNPLAEPEHRDHRRKIAGVWVKAWTEAATAAADVPLTSRLRPRRPFFAGRTATRATLMPLQALPFNTPTRRGHAGSRSSASKPGAVTPPGEEGLLREGGPTCYVVGGHQGAVLKGIPKPRAPSRLQSDQEVPTVTPPPGLWGWGCDLGVHP